MNWEMVPTSKTETTLILRGAATIEHAATLKEALLSALKEYEAIQIETTEVEQFDLSALQLLCSAHRTSVARDKKVQIVGRAASELERAANSAGFLRCSACQLSNHQDNCLWRVDDLSEIA